MTDREDVNEPPPHANRESPARPADPSANPVLHYSSGADDPDGRRGGWVHAWKAAGPFEANLIVGKLQEHGLHARVDMENSASLGPWIYAGGNGTTVQVLAEDVPAVRKSSNGSSRTAPVAGTLGSLACPKCGQRPAKRLLHPARKAAVAALVAMPAAATVGRAAEVPPPAPQLLALALAVAAMVLFFVNVVPRWRCPACRHAWVEPDPPTVDEDDDEDGGD